MEGAECFIEVYKDGDGEVRNLGIRYILYLKQDLYFTRTLFESKTIAVWYIKPKPNKTL